jgi:ubiquinone/menaquinone biosynthesis C-methylase UbiE
VFVPPVDSPVACAMTRKKLLAIAVLCLLPVAAAGQTRDTQREVTEIAKLLELSETSVLADVGAGSGEWTYLLAPLVRQVFATDVKSPQVNGIETVARQRNLTNVKVILGTQEDSGLPASCCDAILLRLVYHAFRNPQMMRESMRKALKPGGRVLIVDFRPPPDQLTQEMNAAGFERLQVIGRWQDRSDVYAVLFRTTTNLGAPSVNPGEEPVCLSVRF